MPSYEPPKKNAECIFYIFLESVATAGAFQVNPTIAAGDFKVSTDGGSLTNLATLPVVTPAGSANVKMTLSASEMNGDNVAIHCKDASGNEWKDLGINLHPTVRQIDDLAYPTIAGRSIDVTSTGEVGIDLANVGSPTTTLDLSGTTIKTATDIQSRLPAALSSGRMVSSVETIATDAINANALAASAVTEIQSGLAKTSELPVAPDNAGITAIKAKTDNLPAAPAAVGNIPTPAVIRAEIDTNSTQLAKLGTPIGASIVADIAAVKADSAAILLDTGTDGVAVSPAGIAAIWAHILVSGYSVARAMRIMLAVLAGKSSGGGTGPIKFRDMADTKDEVTATVDANGNRTSVTRDGS